MRKIFSVLILAIMLISAVCCANSYIGNANTGKFHYADCPAVGKMNPANKVYISSREEAISQGYIPCKRCNP